LSQYRKVEISTQLVIDPEWGGGFVPLDLDLKKLRFGTELLKRGFAKMQKGGVIMDVTNAEQAAIAEEAGAVAVMALERVPADIRSAGGVARMADPLKIAEIIETVSIPVMAKARIGHFAEAQALQTLGVDMIDESEVLTPADPFYHIDKRDFEVPFVCGARNLGEAVRRIFEGAAMIRTKGEAGTGNVIEAVRHQRLINQSIDELKRLKEASIKRLADAYAISYCNLLGDVRSVGQEESKVLGGDRVFEERSLHDVCDGLIDVVLEIKEKSRLPVVNFAAGGLATPADAALMMQLGCDGVFVGSGIFKSENPKERGVAIVEATTNFDDPSVIAEVSKGLGDAMKGLEISEIPPDQRLQERGW
jgi:pyridoxal 5'-phosphate synthase pdxS subunit